MEMPPTRSQPIHQQCADFRRGSSLANGNGLPAGTADAGSAALRGTDLRLYLDRLADALDSSSVRATLKLMLTESAVAIRNQEGLIALEQLAGRDTAARRVRLGELRDAQQELMDAYSQRVDMKDACAAPDGEGCGHRFTANPSAAKTTARCTATGPLVCSFRRLSLGTLEEREARVGAKAVFRPAARWSHAEPTSARHRPARRALRSGG